MKFMLFVLPTVAAKHSGKCDVECPVHIGRAKSFRELVSGHRCFDTAHGFADPVTHIIP
jgi:hypothetical protein